MQYIAAAILVWASIASPVANADSTEDARVAKIKSAYLLNFIRFAEWPRSSFPAANSPVRICLLGQDTLGPVMDGTVNGQAVGGRSIEVVRLAQDSASAEIKSEIAESLRLCHLVFIADSEASRLSSILGSLTGTHILTVGETGSFAVDGAMLALNLERDRVIFYANPDAIRASKVSLSSKILQLARIVHGDDRIGED